MVFPWRTRLKSAFQEPEMELTRLLKGGLMNPKVNVIWVWVRPDLKREIPD